MLCAQALAVVATAAARLPGGGALDVRYNTDDVKRDLRVWAGGKGYPVEEPGPGTLRLRKL